MGAIANGMALTGLRPYAATFFVFSDYMRPSVRLAAIMGLPVLYVYTHDSIGVGEDGPTHQPIEHLAAMRAIPGLFVIRPADANEVAEAYRVALGMSTHPVALVLTRQNVPTLDRAKYAPAAGLQRGGYVLADFPDVGEGSGFRVQDLPGAEARVGSSSPAPSPQSPIPNPQSPIPPPPQVILIASGSEVALCLDARDRLAAEGIAARVVSLASWALFDQQPQEYRDAVLPPDVHARVGVELGLEFGWQKYLGCCGRFVGMKGYGASAPIGVLLKHFGITAENVAAQAKAAIADAAPG
jgi:transketolase